VNQPEVIYEDDALLVIGKPAGMVVNRADTTEVGKTLQDWVESYTPGVFRPSGTFTPGVDIEETFRQRSGIAHRLDKETSGAMLIGKTPVALAELMRQFKARETKKEYIALAHGIIEPKENTINLPIGRNQYNRHKFQVDVFGKNAITRYLVEKSFMGVEGYQDGFTLVHCFPKTGRTHQIRVHMAQIGNPLVGDELYGGRKRVEHDRVWCVRHFLHAAKLTFTHPITSLSMTLEAALPEDLVAALEWLKQRTEIARD